MYFENNEASRERIAAESSLMVYEWCKDLQEMTGKKFQELSQKLLCQSDLVKIRVARKNLKEFYDREKPVISNVRHNVGAHRDHDFMKQREVLDKISWSGTIELLHNFEKLILELGSPMQTLINAGLQQIGLAFSKS